MLANTPKMSQRLYFKQQKYKQQSGGNHDSLPQPPSAGGQRLPVILIHGLFGSLENLGAQARMLAEQFDVYSIDLPNHGRSYHSDVITIDSMADDVITWMDEQKINCAFLVGHSLGGKVAMEVALKAPQKCQKAVVIDIAPVLYKPRHERIFNGLLALDLHNLSTRAQADSHLSVYVEEPAVRSFLLKNLVKEHRGFSWRMNLPAIHACYKALSAANQIPEKPFLGPTLFIKGGSSDYIVEAYREAINTRFPNAKLRIMANTGHWLHAEKPQQVASLITRFLIG